MNYEKTIQLKDGTPCLLRAAGRDDTREVMDVFARSHGETDYLLTYPEEMSASVEAEGAFLEGKKQSACEIEICAVVDGRIVGTAGIGIVRDREKTRHRCEFGISVLKAFWGRGIGLAMTEACIECARRAGFVQMELEAVADNAAAISLYERVGFVEYGRNPKGFRSRLTGWQELVLMRLEL